MCLLSVCFEKHWKDVLWQSFKSYETLGNESLLQYYHEQVTSVVDINRAKKLSNAELIIKLASSSVGEPIFRDLRSEICIPSEEKTSLWGKWNIGCFKVNFTDIDISIDTDISIFLYF